MIDPQADLDQQERTVLMLLISSEGWPVLKKLMLMELEKFNYQMINADPSKPDVVLAAHAMCKSSAQFYQGLLNRIREEVGVHDYGLKMREVQPDLTVGMLGEEL